MQGRVLHRETPVASRGRWTALCAYARRHYGLFWATGVVWLAVAPTAEAMQERRPDDPAVSAPDYRFGHRGRVSTPLGDSPADLAARPAVSVNMSSQLADNLALLFEKFDDTEFIVCLEGSVTEEGVVRFSDFRMPHMAYSRRTSAGVHPDGTCGQYENIVGTLHSHPIGHPDERGRQWNNCYLSRTDIVSWLEDTDYPYTAVMCGPRIWAWWHRSQVDRSKVLAFPPAHQISGVDDVNASKD